MTDSPYRVAALETPPPRPSWRQRLVCWWGNRHGEVCELDEPLPVDAVSGGYHSAFGPLTDPKGYLEYYCDFGLEERVARQFCRYCRMFWTVDMRPPRDCTTEIAESLISGDLIAIITPDEEEL